MNTLCLLVVDVDVDVDVAPDVDQVAVKLMRTD